MTTISATADTDRIAARHSIRAVLFSAIAILSLLLTLGFSQRSLDAWTTYREAGSVQRYDAAANKFIAGIYEILLERLATNNALQSAEPAGAGTIDEIAKHRDIVRENFGPGLVGLSGLDVPHHDQLFGAVRAADAKADQMRGAADRALKMPRDSRDAVLRKEFVPVLTAQVNAALDVWFATIHQVAATDPLLAKLATVKEIGWEMRLISGLERANVAEAIAAGTPIAPAKIVADTQLRARVDVLWDELRHLAAGRDMAPEVRQAMAVAQEKYFDGFVPLADEMRQASDGGGKYRMTAKQWTDTTTPQIGALLEIMYAAGRASEAHTAAAKSEALQTLTVDLTLLLIGFATAAGATAVIRGRVTTPLAILTKVIRQLAAGDTNVVLPPVRRRDEFGLMTHALEVFKTGMTEAARLRSEQEELKRRAEEEKRAAMAKLADEFEASVKAVVGAVSSASSELQATAQSMSATAEQTTRRSTAVAAAAEQASANVHTVASAAEELSSSVSEIGRQVAESTRIASQAVDDAARTNAQVRALADAAQKIGDVGRLINDIAGQTNLLALNATIEAARAGEAGKGFAVVASEVKSLATQTAKATDEIAGQIQAIQTATTDSVKAIETITGTITRISEIATTVASAVEEQDAATKEIARNVQQASAGTAEVSTNIAVVTQAAGETGTASTLVLDAARDLSKQSEALRTEVDGFISKVRAA